MQGLTAADIASRRIPWRNHEMTEGESITGAVLRLPAHGEICGRSLFIGTATELVLAISATAKHGHTVLERELKRQDVTVGDRLTVTYHGMRTVKGTDRKYRHYEVVKA